MNTICIDNVTAELTEDHNGWIAHHDGYTFHVTRVQSGTTSATPSHCRWEATK